MADQAHGTAGRHRYALRVLIPVVLALVVGGLILLALGKDPLGYYGYRARAQPAALGRRSGDR